MTVSVVQFLSSVLLLVQKDISAFTEVFLERVCESLRNHEIVIMLCNIFEKIIII